MTDSGSTPRPLTFACRCGRPFQDLTGLLHHWRAEHEDSWVERHMEARASLPSLPWRSSRGAAADKWRRLVEKHGDERPLAQLAALAGVHKHTVWVWRRAALAADGGAS